MKRGLALSLALGLLLALLSSCEMFVPDPTERPSNWWESAEPTESAGPTENGELGVDEYGFTIFPEGNYLADKKFDTDEYLPDYDADPSFYHGYSTSSYGFCSTEDTIYSFCDHTGADMLITYTDKATGISGPLCGRPECLHRDATCNAYVHRVRFAYGYGGYGYGLSVYDGKLYWIDGGTQIVRANLDGTGRETVGEIQTENYEKPHNQMIVFHRGYVYYAGVSNRIINGKDAYVITLKAKPLDGGEEFVILEKTVDYSLARILLKPVGNELYIMLQYRVVELYRWDSKARQGESLYSETEPPDGIDYWYENSFLPVAGDGIYFTGHSEDKTEAGYEIRYIFKYSFADGEVKTVMTFNDEEDRFFRTGWYSNMRFTRDYLVTLHIDKLDDGTYERALCVFDYDKNLVMTKPMYGNRGIQEFLGADGEYIYFFSIGQEIFSSDTLHEWGDFIFAPLDGGEFLVIPGYDNNWVDGTLV